MSVYSLLRLKAPLTTCFLFSPGAITPSVSSLLSSYSPTTPLVTRRLLSPGAIALIVPSLRLQPLLLQPLLSSYTPITTAPAPEFATVEITPARIDVAVGVRVEPGGEVAV